MPRSSYRFFIRLLFGQMALALLLSFPFSADAQDFDWDDRYGQTTQSTDFHYSDRDYPDDEDLQYDWGHGRDERRPGGDRRRDDRWPETSLNSDIQLHVGQRVYGSTTLSLRQLAQQQGIRLEGERIEAVTLEADVTGRLRVQARLVVNGLPGRWEEVIGRRRPVLFTLPHGQSEVGREIRSLQIEVRGDAVVDSVTLQLEQGRQPWPSPSRELHLRPMRDLYGPLGTSLEVALGLPLQHSSRLVSAITLEASTMGRGVLQITQYGVRGSLGYIPGLTRRSQLIQIVLPRPLPLRDLQLILTDHVRVDTLTIEFLR
jgi:hypothetical protein